MKNEENILSRSGAIWTGILYPSSVAVNINTKAGILIFSDCLFRNE